MSPPEAEPGADAVAPDRHGDVERACLEALIAIPLDSGRANAATRLAQAAIKAIGVGWCEVVSPDNRVAGRSGTARRPGAPVVRSLLGLASEQGRLEAGGGRADAWTESDQAHLENLGRLGCTVLGQVAAYEDIKRRASRLDRQATLHRELLHALGHNLRAPLATIEFAAADLEAAEGDPVVGARARAIRSEAWRLARIVDQVMVSTRLDAGALELDEEPIALARLVHRVAGERGILDRVVVNDSAPGVVALASRAAIEQIAWILLDNAARYATSGPIRVDVEPGGQPPVRALVLAVEDEGPGIVRTERRRIFTRFVRGRSTTGPGTGLGLSVARGLARASGGDITYRPGAIGARFEVRLPAADREPGDDAPG